MNKHTQKKNIEDMLSKLQEISDLTDRSLQLQAEIIDLFTTVQDDR